MASVYRKEGCRVGAQACLPRGWHDDQEVYTVSIFLELSPRLMRGKITSGRVGPFEIV